MILAQASSGSMSGTSSPGSTDTKDRDPSKLMVPKGAGAADPASPGPGSMGGPSSGGVRTSERARTGSGSDPKSGTGPGSPGPSRPGSGCPGTVPLGPGATGSVHENRRGRGWG